jgi:Protein of unknown function (DUF1203)
MLAADGQVNARPSSYLHRQALHAENNCAQPLRIFAARSGMPVRAQRAHAATHSSLLSSGKQKTMNYLVFGLDPAAFNDLPLLDDSALAARRAQRVTVDSQPGFPDRLSLTDLVPGSTAWLIHHTHQPADTPYHASHAIYVAPGSVSERVVLDHLPAMIRSRLISLRAFTATHEMADADIAEGNALEPMIQRFFARSDVAYLHAHFARRGCYAARIERMAK